MYSEKATFSTLLLPHKVPVKSKVEISQNFVAFSEYTNFNSCTFIYLLWGIKMGGKSKTIFEPVCPSSLFVASVALAPVSSTLNSFFKPFIFRGAILNT